MTDREIWNYSMMNNLILLSKDADFFDLYLTNDKRPKVINFRFGNLTLNELSNGNDIMSSRWFGTKLVHKKHIFLPPSH